MIAAVWPEAEHQRYDHWYSCAYCTITEAEAQAVGFEIDHYEPVALRPDLECEDENLNYSCEVCKGRKSDYWPTISQVPSVFLRARAAPPGT